MNYKLLMESWRKFLNEEAYEDDRGLSPPPNVSNIIDLGDRDPTSGDPERERLRVKAQKDKEMMDAAEKLASQPENAFPIVNGKNFELPITGNKKVGSDYHAKRAGGPHLALDQFVKPGTKLVAITNGIIINNNAAQYSKSVKALANLINRRRDKGLLRDDVNISMNGTVAAYRNKKLDDRADNRQKKLDKFNKRFSSDSQIPPAPSDWAKMRRWANFQLGAKLMPTLLRYYNKSEAISYYPILPTKGLGFTLITDPDQYGNQFGFSYAHLEEAPKSGRVKQGEFIGTVGDTAIFDLGGEHLHLGAFVHDDPRQKIDDSGFKRNMRWIDPGRIIKGLGAMRDGVYVDAEKPSKGDDEHGF